jgi:hypothetical protein
MITKKYYVALAHMIGTSANFNEFETKLIRFLETDNSRFNKAKFLTAIATMRSSPEGKPKAEYARVIQ